MPRRSAHSTPVKAESAPAPTPSPSRTRSPRKSKAATVVKEEGTATEDGGLDPATSTLSDRIKRGRTEAAKVSSRDEESTEVLAAEEDPVGATPKRRQKTKAALKTVSTKTDDKSDNVKEPPAKKARKTKVWPPAELDPSIHPPRSGYPPHTLQSSEISRNGGQAKSHTGPLFVGAHCSIAGGAAGALLRAGLAGFNGVAMFVKNQKQWKSNPMEAETIERFRDYMRPVSEGGLGYSAETILVHGSYLINLGNPDPAKWKLSYDCFRDDLERCHQLGIKLYNWHPGSTVGACTREEGYANIARAINKAHSEVPEVITVIENMANAKSNVLGTSFEDLAGIIALVADKSRVRICLDTCHLFAAGYDIRTPEAYAETMRQFREVVGNQYLAGMHLNDSKADFASCKDLHENIGLGHIGLTGFRSIMRDPLMLGLPMILETPMNATQQEGEMMLLESMETKMLYEIQAIPDDEWEFREKEIEARWRADRDRINPPKEKGPKEKKLKTSKKKSKDEEACESHGEEDD